MEIVNLDKCEPFVTKDGSIIREILAHRNSSLQNQSLAEATVLPGDTTQSHYHKLSEEIYFILGGSGRMTIDGQSRAVQVGDAIAIPPWAIHFISNDGAEPLRFLCCCAPGYEHSDTYFS